jgi:hypothetical protein
MILAVPLVPQQLDLFCDFVGVVAPLKSRILFPSARKARRELADSGISQFDSD